MSLTVPFELTHVRYAAGDHVGYALAVASLTPLAAVVALAALAAVRRDTRTISFFAGRSREGGHSIEREGEREREGRERGRKSRHLEGGGWPERDRERETEGEGGLERAMRGRVLMRGRVIERAMGGKGP